MAARRSPGDGTVFKRSDGLWVGGIELPRGDNNKRRVKRVSSKNRNEALRKLKELKAAIAAGYDPSTGRTTVARWMDHWIDKIHAKKKITPATLRSYRATIRNHINPALGHFRLDRITAQDVRNFYETLDSSVAQKAHTVLGLAFKAALSEGLLHRDIMTVVERPQHVKRERGAFSYTASMHILHTALEVGDDMWTARWAAGFMTGGRQGEILGLTWDRVYLDDDNLGGELDLSWQLLRQQKVHGCGDPVDGIYPCGKKRVSSCPQARWNFPPGFESQVCERSFVWSRPKTQAGRRRIPLIEPMAAALARVQRIDGPNPHNLVFHHPDGKPIGQDQDQKAWTELLKRAGISHVEQHTMRHSTATLLLEAGVDSHIVQAILGHTDETTTRGYQHVDISLARTALSNLKGLLAITPPD